LTDADVSEDILGSPIFNVTPNISGAIDFICLIKCLNAISVFLSNTEIAIFYSSLVSSVGGFLFAHHQPPHQPCLFFSSIGI
jgi:hypothetical protein